MPRHSTHSQKLTPATVPDSDNDFIAVASESDKPYIIFFILLTYILFSILGSVDGKDAESDVV